MRPHHHHFTTTLPADAESFIFADGLLGFFSLELLPEKLQQT